MSKQVEREKLENYKWVVGKACLQCEKEFGMSEKACGVCSLQSIRDESVKYVKAQRSQNRKEEQA